jgi:hypothetical protein
MNFHRDPEICDHLVYRDVKIVEEDWDGERTVRVERKPFSTEEDLDLHRTRCTQCGKIGYYSGAARAYFEEGKRSPGIKGLE